MNRAVAVIFGTALGKISTPLVNDILTPPVGLLLCGVALQRAAHHAGFRRSIDTSPSPSRRRCHAQLRSLPQRRRPLAAMIAAMFAVVRQVNMRNEAPDELTLVPRDEELLVLRLCDPGGGVAVPELHVQVDKRPRNVDLWLLGQRRAVKTPFKARTARSSWAGHDPQQKTVRPRSATGK